MSEVKISVIVPVYNTEEYLPRCLDSIIGQTFDNIEVIVVDDGSTDNSYSVCREYAGRDTRIRLFHKENGGASSARNLALVSYSHLALPEEGVVGVWVGAGCDRKEGK